MTHYTSFETHDGLSGPEKEKDLDLVTLNRLYLAKARDLAGTGQGLRASYLLGIPKDIQQHLLKLPLCALEALAEEGLLIFQLRLSLAALRNYTAALEDPVQRLHRTLHLVASNSRSPSGRVIR